MEETAKDKQAASAEHEWQQAEAGLWKCRYQKFVRCKDRDCARCGWNPEVAKARSVAILEKMGGYIMAKMLDNERSNPCRGCPDRYPACSDHCQKPEKLDWSAEQEKIRQNRKNYRSPTWIRRESLIRRRR